MCTPCLDETTNTNQPPTGAALSASAQLIDISLEMLSWWSVPETANGWFFKMCWIFEGFHSHGSYPQLAGWLRENPIYKSMLSGAAPVLGNPHGWHVHDPLFVDGQLHSPKKQLGFKFAALYGGFSAFSWGHPKLWVYHNSTTFESLGHPNPRAFDLRSHPRKMSKKSFAENCLHSFHSSKTTQCSITKKP